ncbi:MAG TPA: DNA repair protein RadA [Stellaceae bacterium]|nr:DNA repair protein RadA [Stellaceae bacterium]
MPKPQSRYACQECGAVAPKWVGRCEACGAWNSLVEELPRPAPPKSLAASGPGVRARRRGGAALDFVGLRGDAAGPPRLKTGIAELDRVCGGGLVPGSTILVGGDPGIGKSTLLLQAAAALAGGGIAASFVTGEEAIDQVRLRAERLGVAERPVRLAAAGSVRDIIAALDEGGGGPGVAVIDSIQTMYLDTLDSAPGTVSQVRGAAQELIGLAKRTGLIVVLVGHVTKEGLIAGPRVLEHMVDTVLYFEGERGHQFRILRAVKNRYGATDEIGVFEMSDRGLVEVPNPSSLFLAERTAGDEAAPVTGTAVFAGIEGTRPLLVEVQALVAPSPLGTPRRAVVGWDATRLAMIAAVLDARCGLSVGANDIYLNIAGGLRIVEPAADLAVAAALVSALTECPVPADTVVFGEIGLSGRVRPVAHAEARLKEAAKLGFAASWAPPRSGRRDAARRERDGEGLATVPIAHLSDLVARLVPPGRGRRRPAPRGIMVAQ